ncbi:alpha-ketoglutarate-dependent dioxygenase AlkB family protein [Burkholderia sp. 22PA0106]|uniref:alpha-ketoglutarate-dependent dioxygenase AlkB family protein n=1 Tax=Burkholderia sp. 22PA0106 TaxID=3237371 RepID=UPI0039C2475D
MDDLFDTLPAPDVDWHPDWLPRERADLLLAHLLAEVDWKQESIRTPRGPVPMPRLTAWQGEPDAIYVYSGLRNIPAPWTPAVAELRALAEAACATRFNSVLLNRYRSGADGMGWHSDNEPELGEAPVIASVSLGVARMFDLRHRETGVVRAYRLAHGSLLVMHGATQRDWTHRLAKAPAVQGERINLTFRFVTPRRAR